MTAEAFRRWYESRGLSQREVARLLGIYQSRVTRMASGKVPVSAQTERMLLLVNELAASMPGADSAERTRCLLYWMGHAQISSNSSE